MRRLAARNTVARIAKAADKARRKRTDMNWRLFPDSTMTYKRVRMAQGYPLDSLYCPVGTGRGYNDKEEP